MITDSDLEVHAAEVPPGLDGQLVVLFFLLLSVSISD